MNQQVDRSIVALFVGPLVGLLVMKGVVSPDHSDEIVQLADTVIGGLIALFTIIGYIAHHTAIQKHKETLSAPKEAKIIETTPGATTTINVDTTPTHQDI